MIRKELDDTLKLVIKHSLFGTKDSLNLVLSNLPQDLKEYMLMNLTKFTNNLVDLISKIKINTKGNGLLIKSVIDIHDPLNEVEIDNNTLLFKSNHLVKYSTNVMIKSIDTLQSNMYDKVVEVLMVFFYNDNYVNNLEKNNLFYSSLRMDQVSEIVYNLITGSH